MIVRKSPPRKTRVQRKDKDNSRQDQKSPGRFKKRHHSRKNTSGDSSNRQHTASKEGNRDGNRTNNQRETSTSDHQSSNNRNYSGENRHSGGSRSHNRGRNNRSYHRSQGSHHSAGRSSGNRGHHNRRRPHGQQDLFHRRLDLLRQHNEARKSYYENYNLVDEHLKKKLERKFYQTLEQLRKLESYIYHKHRHIYNRLCNPDKHDTTYSNNHEIDLEKEQEREIPPFQEESHIHISEAQLQRPDYKDDEEESVGSMEDYKKLKGLA